MDELEQIKNERDKWRNNFSDLVESSRAVETVLRETIDRYRNPPKHRLGWAGMTLFTFVGFAMGLVAVEWYIGEHLEYIKQTIEVCRGTR